MPATESRQRFARRRIAAGGFELSASELRETFYTWVPSRRGAGFNPTLIVIRKTVLGETVIASLASLPVIRW